jgi:hypothetical protein
VVELFPGDDPDEILNLRLENGVARGDHMPFVRAMMKASEFVREDGMSDDPTQRRGPGAKTPAEAQGELDKLMADPSFKEAYFNPSHIEHKAALAKVDELYAYKGKEGALTNVSIGSRDVVSVTPRSEPQ